MFIKTNEILENLEDSTSGKKVVSINVANKMEEKLNTLLSDNKTIITELDKQLSEYIKGRFGTLETFPVNNPKIDNLYLYDNKIYKLIGHNSINKIVVGTRGCFILTNDNKVYYCGYNTAGEGGFDVTGVKKVHEEVTFTTEILPSGDKIIDISHSDYSTHFLTDKGNVIVCGQNTSGNLGMNNATNQTKKIKCTFEFPSKVKKIIVGGSLNYPSTFYLLEDGKIYCCGTNSHGQLATGDTAQKNIPTEITSKFTSKVVDVSTGCYTTNGGSTIFLTEDNKLFTIGYNNVGQLGNGTTTDSLSLVPVSIPNQGKVTHIASGGGVISFVINGTDLYSAGYNENGALGNGTKTNSNKFILIKSFHSKIKQIKHYSSVARETFSAILLENGEVYTSGYNGSGQLGMSHTSDTEYYNKINCNEKIKQIGVSYRGLHMLNYKGEILVFGNNDQHQLGTSTTNNTVQNYQYSVFFSPNVTKATYDSPDTDFIQII